MEHPFIGNVKNPERVSRLVILLVLIIRPILLIPQYIVLFVWGLLSAIVLFIMYIVAIFTARYPDSLFNFVLGFYQKILQIELYANGLFHKYPPFVLGSGEVRETQKSQQM